MEPTAPVFKYYYIQYYQFWKYGGLTFKLYQAYKLSQTDNNRLFVMTIEICHVISFRLEQNKTVFSQINFQHQKNYLVFSTPSGY